eukprot:gene20030-21993_t
MNMVAVNGLESQAQKLLDFKDKLDVSLLDKVVASLYSGEGPQHQVAKRVLQDLKDHPDSWTRVDSILETSLNQETKFFALQILETVIKTRWKILPVEQREGIKKYTVGLVIKISSDSSSLESEKTYLNKLNIILVQIVKREWPKNWPTFISDIVGASQTNESLCQNNMSILRLLSEEVFDFSSGQLTQTKAKHLKDSMCQEFSLIFKLCEFVMENSMNVALVESTLQFLNVPMFRNVTLKCLTEIAGISNIQYTEQFVLLYTLTKAQLNQMLPIDTNLKQAYINGNDDEQKFIQNLAMFLSIFLKEHGHTLEKKIGERPDSRFFIENVDPPFVFEDDLKAALLDGLQYLVLISEVDDIEIFKICLEYWSALASDLYRESPFSTPSTMLGSPSSLSVPLRRQIYLDILSKLRLIMISRMAKPEEVLVVENEQGEVIREFMKDTDAINMYKTMRETLVYLTHLDYEDTERIMTEKLRNQVNGTEWSWKNLNTLCWALGSISGAMHEEDEKRFLVIFIKELLGLCEVKRGKDNKAIIASNIMYSVGQYPRFLRAHWKFLKTVVNKLFEFMHETHDGVQDMACDTFIKIAQRCRRHFVQVQIGEVMPFIEEILNNINTIICDLQPQQVHVFYEAVGCMISAQTDTVVTDRLIEKCMQLPNQVWDGIIASATKNIEVLKEIETVKQLANILKTNVSACKSVGHLFINQLGRIYLDMVNVYKVLSENISSAVAQHGEGVTKQPLIRAMRGVKKDSLNLINCWVNKSNDPKLVKDNFIPPLLSTVLDDYNNNVPQGREAEVLNTMATLINKLELHIIDEIPLIFDAVFECTLEMINKDFQEYPDHRTNFFILLEAVNQHCFPALLKLAAPQFKLVLDSIIWAFKHTMRNVADIGLGILHGLLINIQQHSDAQSFYQTYYTMILQHIFSVVTDTSHTAALTKHASILAHMFTLVEDGGITVALFDQAQSQNNNMTNELYIKEFTAALLKQAYPHLLQQQIKIFVQGLFDLDNDISAFKEHLRDFLVQIKENQGEDCDDLYLEERESQLKSAQEEKRKRQMAVPGILNPHEITEEMQD